MINPIAFSLGPINVYWYGVIFAVAILLATYLTDFEGQRVGLPKGIFFELALFVVPTAILFARIYYVIFHLEEYVAKPFSVFAIWQGGLAIHGGIIGGLLSTYLFSKFKKISFLKLTDVSAPNFLLAQAIGRWGNFINQEAYGSAVDKAFLTSFHLPTWVISQMNISGIFHHPTFLYESLWDLLGFVFLVTLRYTKGIKLGEITAFYFMFYSVGRFFIEGFRMDSLAFFGPKWLEETLLFLWSPLSKYFAQGVLVGGNIRVAQVVSLILFIFFFGFFIYLRFKKKVPYYNLGEN